MNYKSLTTTNPHFIHYSYAIFIAFILSSCTASTNQETTAAATQSSPNVTPVAVVMAKAQAFPLQLLSNYTFYEVKADLT